MGPPAAHEPLLSAPSDNITKSLSQKRQALWAAGLPGTSCGSTKTNPFETCAPPASQDTLVVRVAIEEHGKAFAAEVPVALFHFAAPGSRVAHGDFGVVRAGSHCAQQSRVREAP
jgi:hypothetical protein